MTDTFLISIAKESILTALKVAAPVLIVSMLIGLIISILQAVTQIQEQTLTFVPKMIAIVIVFLILGPWMVKTLVKFTEYMINSIIYVVK